MALNVLDGIDSDHPKGGRVELPLEADSAKLREAVPNMPIPKPMSCPSAS
jgi:hypothetical protein